MDNTYMTEMSLDEQNDVRGGDWYDTAFGLVEGLLMAFWL
jgi:hypothetical protein